MPQTVDLILKPSARAHHWLFWLHVIPLVLLPMSMRVSEPVMLALVIGIGLSWVWLRRHPAFGYGPRAWVRIVANADGRWTLERANRERVESALLGDSTVQSWLLILNFRDVEGRRYTRILLGDEAPGEALRRLRARLAAGPTDAGPETSA